MVSDLPAIGDSVGSTAIILVGTKKPARVAFGCFSCGEGNVLVKKGGALKDAGRYYENAIIKQYEKVRKLIAR